MDKVYDEERQRILKVGINLQRMWRDIAPKISLSDPKQTAKIINEFSKQVEGQYERIGFRAVVDADPIYADQPPGITILERLTSIGEFDFDKAASEVRKA